jgi:hypothetical protein
VTGPTGPTGPTATGPTGPTGPIGPTGPAGGGGGSTTIYTESVVYDATNFDTFRRITITNASVLSTSNIVISAQRPAAITDDLDLGYIYAVTVINIATGSFDVLVAALDWGMDDPMEEPPQETIKLCYMIG